MPSRPQDRWVDDRSGSDPLLDLAIAFASAVESLKQQWKQAGRTWPLASSTSPARSSLAAVRHYLAAGADRPPVCQLGKRSARRLPETPTQPLISIEALVLQPHWAVLFTAAELRVAREQLEDGSDEPTSAGDE